MAGLAYNISRELGLAEFNPEVLARTIQDGIDQGSKRNLLCWTDFDFKVNHGVDVNTIVNADIAVKNGMHYLDSLWYFMVPNRPTTVVIGNRDEGQNLVNTAATISRGLFALFFSVYSQARADGQGSNNFLTNVLGFGRDWIGLVRGLTSLQINKIPTSWARHITFTNLSDEAKNRIALGAAGQRYLQAITYIREGDYNDGQEHSRAFLNALRAWTAGKVWWDLHPISKSQNVITVTKSLNKSIEDCLAVALKPEAIQRLVGAKILHHAPVEQPAHAQWRSFETNLLPPLSHPIFEDNINP